MSSEMTMSVPSLASVVWELPPAMGVPPAPVSSTIFPSSPLRTSS